MDYDDRRADEDEEEDTEYADDRAIADRPASVPDSLKGLRACMVCSLCKTFEQFYNEGCDNCNGLGLQMADRQDRVSEYTSPYFEGMISMMQPEQSWVAKYQAIPKQGVYAMEVTGTMPADAVEWLKNKNVQPQAKPA